MDGGPTIGLAPLLVPPVILLKSRRTPVLPPVSRGRNITEDVIAISQQARRRYLESQRAIEAIRRRRHFR